MSEIKYKQYTKVINSNIEIKDLKKVITKEQAKEEKKIIEIEYNGQKVEYDLYGNQNLFEFTDLLPLNLYKVINVDEINYFLYTNEDSDLIITPNMTDILKFKSKVLKLNFFKKELKIYLLGFIQSKIQNLNEHNIKFKFKIGNYVIKDVNIMPIYNKKQSRLKKLINKNNFFKLNVCLSNLVDDDDNVFVNNSVCLNVVIGDAEKLYPVKMKKKVKNSKYNYLVIKYKKIDDYYIMVRKSVKQNLMIIKRELEPIEYNKLFQFYESRIMTNIFKILGSIYKLISLKKINLYFEKFASKAEEGTFELFELARDNSKKSKNYFIIEKNEENNKCLSKKNVVAKFSFKYYMLAFAASNIISTEAPAHLNLLRTVNRQIKKSIYNKKFVFLQHGIIYLKNLGINSTFSKGKDAYPDLFVVSSKKEAKVVNQMLKIPKNRLIITGLAILDKVKYNHINQNSKDKIVIMLTWKPYEEQLKDFTKSTYYQYTLNIYEILSKYIDPENIVIIPHPKVKEKMLSTPFGKSVYSGLISDVLCQGKLLITDYSSICYNSFYQGAGVIFYHSDLQLYEEQNGPLIPEQNEYIGYRCFNDTEFKNIIKKGITNNKINLNYFRTNEFIKTYNLINEFHDGKNSERIYSELRKNNIV